MVRIWKLKFTTIFMSNVNLKRQRIQQNKQTNKRKKEKKRRKKQQQ